MCSQCEGPQVQKNHLYGAVCRDPSCDSCAGCGGPGGILQKLYPGEERNADPSDRPAAEKRGFPVMIEAEN